MKVECLCINARNRPSEILPQNWISEGMEYHITHVSFLAKQGIQGVLLEEVQTKHELYQFYRLDRFAFTEESYNKLRELIYLCTQLNDIDINKLLEECNLEKVEKDGNKHTKTA